MRHSAFFSVSSGEVSVTLPDDLKGATAGIIGADGSAKTVQESNANPEAGLHRFPGRRSERKQIINIAFTEAVLMMSSLLFLFWPFLAIRLITIRFTPLSQS